MPKDLRSFIDELKKEPFELVAVDKEIDPCNFEATALMAKLVEREKYPAVLFNRPKNLKGKLSYAKLLLRLFSSHRRAEISLGLAGASQQELVEEYARREELRIKPLVIDPAQAPVKEVIRTGKDADLSDLPIVRHFEMDGNPYIDTAVAAFDREYGNNVSYQRMMYLDANHTGIHMSPRHLWTYFKRREERALPLPLAVVVGHHPGFYMGSQTLAPIDADEYEIIGGILGEPLRLVPSEAYGSDLMVPADAEIIIEGEIVPNVRTVEGPFGEWTGYYGPQRLRWLVKIKAITHRKVPIYTCHSSGQEPEGKYVSLALEAGLLKAVKAVAPSTKAVACLGRGLRSNIVISMNKRMEGEPVSAALAALAATDYAKHVIVVDKDINPWNMPDVMWAVGMRVQAEEDVTIIKKKKGNTLDPSTPHELATSAMIIDATVPLNRPFERPFSIPDWALDRIRLEDYFSEEFLEKARYDGTFF